MEQNENRNESLFRAREPGHPFIAGWNRLGLVVLRYWIIGLGIASYVGAAFLPALFSPLYEPVLRPWSVLWENLVGIGSIIGTIFLLYFGSRDVRKLSEIRSENEALRAIVKGTGQDLFDVWHTHLWQWSRELNFGGGERVSLYKHSEGRFIMLGRYSENAHFTSKGRGVYPADEGCIGRAWRSTDGYDGIDGLPDPSDEAGYAQAQLEQCGMPGETVAKLRMKPRSIAAFTIMDETGTRRSAIIVFESTNPNKFSALGLGEFLRGGKARLVTLLMAAMKNQEPSLELATQEGF